MVYKELPTVFPFYEGEAFQYRNRANTEAINCFKLISPKDSLLPFQISMPKNKQSPTKWEIINIEGKYEPIDITQHKNKVKIYELEDRKQAVFFGQGLSGLNMRCGYYYSKFTFSDRTTYASEVFYVPQKSFDSGYHGVTIKIEFFNNTDIEPILYRDNWKQCIYLDTYISSWTADIEEEVEKDGAGNSIPIFQRLVTKIKLVDVVPDYFKVALISMQMADSVFLDINMQHRGFVSNVKVTTQAEEVGGLNIVEVIFEDAVLVKNLCQSQRNIVSLTNW